MALLADWLLEVDGKVFGTSWPQKGDITRSELNAQPEAHSSKLSFGVSSADLPALTSMTGKSARLLDINGQEVGRLRIDKVDPDFAILVAAPLTQEPTLPPNAIAERAVSTRGLSGKARST